ncbi:MAG: hypothetical protein J6K98_00935 [Clostridia bacterium]|nr:hypothetical protein [Clostridia bacterium]
MNRQYVKRWLAGFLSAVMLLSVSGCVEGGEESSATSPSGTTSTTTAGTTTPTRVIDLIADPDVSEVGENGIHPRKPIAERIGATHAAGVYSLNDRPYLLQGADAMKEAGFKTMKVWLMRDYRVKYPYNSTWGNYRDMTALAKSEYYTALFTQYDFSTYVLETEPFNIGIDFSRKLSERTKEKIYKEYYDLAVYFLDTFKGTGKTFVLQNWEGDWMYAGTTDLNSANFKDPVRLQAFTDYLNTVQQAVNDARGSVNCMIRDNVFVYACAEINMISDPRILTEISKSKFCINNVIPKLHMDLYSYSNYQTWEYDDRLREFIRYYQEKAADSVAFGNNNIMLGEYGAPENGNYGEYKQQWISGKITRVMMEEFNAPYMLYWQLFCNEPINREEEGSLENNLGFWLIRPDGTKPSIYWWFRQYMGLDIGGRFTNGKAAAFLEDLSEGWGMVNNVQALYGVKNLIATNGAAATADFQIEKEQGFMVECYSDCQKTAEDVYYIEYLDEDKKVIGKASYTFEKTDAVVQKLNACVITVTSVTPDKAAYIRFGVKEGTSLGTFRATGFYVTQGE